MKVGVTIQQMLSMTVHQVFVTLFKAKEEKGYDRIEMLKDANGWRAKKGNWPVIPLWLWREKK